jgi:hypothetical protein
MKTTPQYSICYNPFPQFFYPTGSVMNVVVYQAYISLRNAEKYARKES